MMNNKRGAVELSVGTIVIVVLAVVMLILGMVLVRSIMCKAIGLTSDINTKVESEINKIFGSTDAEVACIGAGVDIVKMVPGQQNVVFCSVRAKAQAQYTFKLVSAVPGSSSLSTSTLQSWMVQPTTSTTTISPGDNSAKKVIRINVPDTAPETSFTLNMEISRNNELIYSPSLDFQISRVGFVRSAMC